MIDLHSHILPGLDDGAPDWPTSVEMGRVAVAEGIETIAATPHVNFEYQYPLSEIRSRAAELNRRLAESGLPLTVVTGGEIALSRLVDLSDEDLQVLGLGGTRTLLIESPYSAAAGGLEAALFDLQLRHFNPLLAHPERCPYFQSDPDRLTTLVERGIHCSINSGSMDGTFGSTVRRFAIELLRRGLVHAVSSDSHDPAQRAPRLLSGFEEGERALPGLMRLVGWLTADSPRCLLAGEVPPPRPDVRLGKRSRLRRSLRI